MNKRRLVTHGDTDGVVSATLMYSIQLSKYNSVVITDYSEIYAKEESKRFHFQSLDTVVDLPQPDIKVEFWADHHETGMRYGQPSYEHLFNPTAQSCAGLIFQHFKDKFPKIKRFKELVINTDIIDSAGYKDPEELYDLDNSGMRIRLAIMAVEWNYANKYFKPALIKELAEGKDWKKVLDNPFVKTQAVFALAQIKEYEKAVDGFIKLEDKVVVTEIFDKKKIHGISNRYYAFKKFPKAIFGLSLIFNKGLWDINFSENPFKKDKKGNHPSTLNLGKLAKSMKESGGGHKGIGVVKGIPNKEKSQIKKGLIELLNQNN